jgi:hypothetical protein
MTDQTPAMCECSHHWYVHGASGMTAPDRPCHGYTGNATPGPLRDLCACASFRPWPGPRDSRTGEPVKPIAMVATAPGTTTPAAAERERWHASLANLHRPFGIHDECYCKGGEHTGTTVTNCGEFETCLPPTYLVCRHCCCDTDDCYQTEACVDSHDHGPGEPICETAALVADLIGEAL